MLRHFVKATPALLVLALFAASAESQDKPLQRPLRVDPASVASDKSIKYDYDIVYVRAPRTAPGKGDKEQIALVWPDASQPFQMRASTDLVLLHPDGKDEVLVAGAPGAIADPYVSFDAKWVYYTRFHDVTGRGGADVYKVHVASRKVVRLTEPQATRGTEVPASGKGEAREAVYNMHPCPLPGGRVVFVSNRDGLVSPGNKGQRSTMQLFVMDDDGTNVEKIGHLNLGSALHPTILKDGRIIFSTLESQGLRDRTKWGIWSIHPDGTNWGPVVSAYENYGGGIFHFQAQLSDESVVVGNYYIQGMGGFGTYLKFPGRPPADTPAFAAAKEEQKDFKMFMAGRVVGLSFKPYGVEVLTHFLHSHDSASSDLKEPKSHHLGRVSQPSGAPDNHLLTVWTGAWAPAGSRAGQTMTYPNEPPMDTGIYLIKEGRPIWEPGAMLLVKNDPNYNEQWPRPLVPYERIYGVKEPQRLPTLRNDGTLSKCLPEGTPFGLIGTSSLYKRESYPDGVVKPGSVTATGGPYAAFATRASVTNWTVQGADAGLYSNSDIHAIRIVALEPPSMATREKFTNAAGERIRILGEFPVRKFGPKGNDQPLDPDGNPDTSFLARIPADVPWTFQTLDKHGMLLNAAQTWHQLRPGEVRHDCGGCHSHSQKPTDFKLTAAARPDYVHFDLTQKTPLLTTKQKDQSGRKWDVADETGLHYVEGVVNVEYRRDIRPIFERSCVACHTSKSAKPAGGLVLDDDTSRPGDGRPATYDALLGGKDRNSEPYVWPFRSRNSPLVWKLFGHRIDGYPEKEPAEKDPSYRQFLARGGVPWKGFQGSMMPPPEAVAGTYAGPDGQKIKVAPLSDEDRRTIFRWIDLGCPVDRKVSSGKQQVTHPGWLLDEQRPTLTLTYPQPGVNKALTRILVGMHDYSTGLDMASFAVVADFPINGIAAGENLATKFKALPDNRWELTMDRPITDLPRGKLNVSIKDKQGNVTQIERSLSIRPE